MKFKALRKQAGLSLVEVEKRTAINRSRLSAAERGQVKLSAAEVYLLRTILAIAYADRMKEGGQE